MNPVEGEYWRARDDGRIDCLLCPKRCLLAEGQSGSCKVRVARAGALVLPYFAAITSLAVDPIEKKPLYHFLPGSSVFSAGFVGCNLHCPFCQNWEIAQTESVPTRRVGPDELVRAALDARVPSIAFTYSEPLVHFEYVKAAMLLARRAGLRTVLVTNGCVNPEPAYELLSLADATNVDLKCWSPKDYRSVLGGERDAVLSFIKASAAACHTEVTTLVVPGLSDASVDIREIARFLASISRDLPYHLSAYHPAWKRRDPPTDPSLLASLAKVARGELRYVYVGNIAGEDSDTRCPSCAAKVIRRRGYETNASGLRVSPGRTECAACGGILPIVGL